MIVERVAAGHPGAEPLLTLAGVSKVYGRGRRALLALDGFDLEVAPGELVCLVGASGCGKSTLLSLLAGLDEPTSGRIASTSNRRPALVFQEAALLPWLTAADNIALPMRLAHVGARERAAEVERLLALVRLEGMGDKRPHELSGGMRQRVALARALAQRSEVLLMDEPFAALDAITRDLLHEDLLRVWRQTGVAIVFVTHNVREAARLGDRIVVLSSRPGRVIEEVPVALRRPRELDSPGVAAMASRVTAMLREEIGRHG